MPKCEMSMTAVSQPKVTVLVAVYNAGPFLRQCLDSLLSQTLRDIQIVCVDDASTDDSLQLLNAYALSDLRIEVIRHAQNLGLAKARNTALKASRGEYVCMVDADDWLSPDALEQAVKVFEAYRQTDAVLFRFVLAYADHIEDFPCQPFEVLDGHRACELSLTWKIHGLYMIRADIHKRYPYDDTCRVYSDENTTRVHYAVCREVRCCAGIYYYRQHAASATHRLSVHKFDKLRAKESLISSLQNLGVDTTTVVNQLWLDVIDVYMFYVVHGSKLTAADRRYGLQEIHRVWSTIDRRVLSKPTTCKLGYYPCRSWLLFRIQEWLYFTLRGFLGKNY